MLPGGPARGVLGVQATPEQIAQFNQQQGYDRPLWEQYLAFLGRLLTGDLGQSYLLNMSVADAISMRLPKTLLLTGLSLVIALLIAVPVGIFQAVRRNRGADYTLSTLAIVAYSTPSFFLGMLLIMIFSQTLGLLPANAPQGETVAAVLAELCATHPSGAHRRDPARRQLQPVHAFVCARQPQRGLHPHGAFEGHSVRSACSPSTSCATRSRP